MSHSLRTVLLALVVGCSLASAQTQRTDGDAHSFQTPMTFESCTAAPGIRDSEVLRDSTKIVSLARIESESAPNDDVCVVLDSCIWKISRVPQSISLPMIDHLIEHRAEECKTRSSNYRSECSSPSIDDRLSSISGAIRELTREPGTLCGGTYLVPMEAHFLNLDGISLLMISAGEHSGSFCLSFAIETHSMGLDLLFTDKCPDDENVWRTLLQSSPVDPARAGLNWVIGSFSVGEVALKLDSVGSQPLVWGWPNGETSAYVDRWIRAVAKVANSQSALKLDSDPFPGANPNSFAGRASRWFVAGLEQTASRHFSGNASTQQRADAERARRWMARQVLAMPELSDTYLRGELATGEVAFK
jgi:hypothetical protein